MKTQYINFHLTKRNYLANDHEERRSRLRKCITSDPSIIDYLLHHIDATRCQWVRLILILNSEMEQPLKLI